MNTKHLTKPQKQTLLAQIEQKMAAIDADITQAEGQPNAVDKADVIAALMAGRTYLESVRNGLIVEIEIIDAEGNG